MKKLLFSSVILLIFSCSILLFQISCKKDAVAQTPINSPLTLTKKILYVVRPIGASVGLEETWISDYDGSGATQIPLHVAGWEIHNPKMSSDGTKIFFSAIDSSTLSTQYSIEVFSANIDGSNIQQINELCLLRKTRRCYRC